MKHFVAALFLIVFSFSTPAFSQSNPWPQVQGSMLGDVLYKEANRLRAEQDDRDDGPALAAEAVRHFNLLMGIMKTRGFITTYSVSSDRVREKSYELVLRFQVAGGMKRLRFGFDFNRIVPEVGV